MLTVLVYVLPCARSTLLTMRGSCFDVTRHANRLSVGTRCVVLIALVVMITGCSTLPTVDDGIVRTLESPDVAIVTTAVQANPTDEWNYTYALMDVTDREGIGSDEVLSRSLIENGWAVSSHQGQLVADRVESGLVVLRLEDFLNNRWDPVATEFRGFSNSNGANYFVAILMPYNYQ